MLPDNIQANKLEILGKLTASLIHEIRNSLSVITFNLEYLDMIKDELPDSAKESVGDSSLAAGRIQYLVDNLLGFVKKNGANVTNVSVNDVTIGVAEIIRLAAKKLSVKVEIMLEDGLPDISFDQNRLYQVFLNLVTNAVESCGKEGKVTIKSYKSGGFVYWEVSDNGRGIREQDKDKIFSDFYTNKKNGTGLGLSVCKKLLDEMDAEISFESEYGSGSTFIIRFDAGRVTEEK